MKVINFGNTFQIHADDLKTYGALPVKTYKVNFSKMTGFSLVSTNDYVQTEEKIYGNLARKVDKAFRTRLDFERSLGIILSGNKGMGKSLFTQLSAVRAIEEGVPVIRVEDAYPGIANFLDSIEQEVLVIFDEFEKVFDQGSDGESQEKLLGLFDGTSQQKRMYILTVNELHRVSDFMINRPGRFHYHIRIEYPTPDEITEYLQDKMSSEYYGEIRKVISFGQRVPLNYDSLRAIAYEIDSGSTFEESIGDLNILNIERQNYDVEVLFEDAEGNELPGVLFDEQSLNLFSESEVIGTYYPEDIRIQFSPQELQTVDGNLCCLGETAEVIFDSDNKTYVDGVEVTMINVKTKPQETLNYRI